MTKRLDRLLSLIRDASRARFLGSRSFSHELEAKHVQQVTQGGGFTAFGDDGTLTFEYRVPERVCFRGDSYLPLSVLLAIVDEVTSQLDVAVQKEIQAKIDDLGITRIVIAHRLSTIRNADTIHVLDRGRIVQSGDFETLAAEEGPFRTKLEKGQL